MTEEIVDNSVEFLTEEHSKYNFGEPDSSTYVAENGDTFDHSFRVESGKVSYDKKEDGTYLVSYRNELKDNEIEKRILSLDLLSKWFYEPSNVFYDGQVSAISIILD
jgi:hypothetical protein